MKRMTPLRAIRAFCIECAGTSPEASKCTANKVDIEKARKEGDDTPYPECPLWPFRKGHYPKSEPYKGPKAPN